MKLHISDDLSLPLDAVTQKFGILGRTGSGKSYFATKLCEEMLDAKAQVVVLDPVGVWWGLRVGADGKSDGYKIPVFGGLRGDVPLEPGGGTLLADLIVDKIISAVVDLSGFLLSEQRKFATDFAMQFFHRKKSQRSAVHLFVEESQEFVPQQVRGDVAKMVGAYERLLKLGRNFGIGASLISQRPQSVNKDVLNQTECLFTFQMTGPQERKAVESWVAEKGLEKDIVGELPKLKVGEAHVWSPQWLRISKTIKVAAKKTADVSATPKPDVKPIDLKQLSQIELEDLSDKMLATIERAKKEDPKELRKEIFELRRALDAKQTVKQVETKIIETPILKDSQIARIEKIVDRVKGMQTETRDDAEALVSRLDGLIAPLKEALFLGIQGVPARVPPNLPDRSRLLTDQPTPKREPPRRIEHAANNGEFAISAPQQRILDALAWYESIGNFLPSTLQVGAVALIDANGGYFSNTVGPLSANGLVQRGQGTIALTDEGRKYAKLPQQISSLDDYHEMLRHRVRRARSAGGKTVDMLDAIIRKGGEELTAEELGNEVNIDHSGGYFSNMIGPLSTIGLVRRSHGRIQPTEIVFPPGLR